MSFTVAAHPRKRVGIDCSKDGLTEQSHSKACDVNRIVKRFERDGIRMDRLPGYIDLTGAKFGDFSDGVSYLDACNAVMRANNSFMELPAELRAKFRNDPAQFLDFVSNPDNKDEMVKLGLIAKPDISSPVNAEGEPADAESVGRTSST